MAAWSFQTRKYSLQKCEKFCTRCPVKLADRLALIEPDFGKRRAILSSARTDAGKGWLGCLMSIDMERAGRNPTATVALEGSIAYFTRVLLRFRPGLLRFQDYVAFTGATG
jgi:hypothetical protein